MARKRAKKGGEGKIKKRTPRTRRPPGMTLEEWQVALRREFGREQKFKLRNTGSEPVFSEYLVTNPQTGRTYRVAVRGTGLGENYCSCPDFAVNALGTCKHIEFTLARLSRRRGGKRALARGFRPAYSEVYLRYGARRDVVFRPGLDCPRAMETFSRRFFGDGSVLTEEGYASFDEFARRAASDDHEVRIYDDARALVAEVRDRKTLGERVADAFPKGEASPALKGLVKARLYRYQRQGALFCARAGRSLLADDMGLGKTVQAIAAAEILARVAGLERVLVVSPASVKHQWKQEIERFTDRDAVVVGGLLASRARCYAEDSFYKITNYDVVHRDLNMIRRWSPDLVILDEAQRIKNWKTRTARSVKALDSEYAMVLTGTPIENRLEELHSIVEFVDRFRLGPLFRFLAEHQHADEHGRVVGYRNLSKISETLAPVLVRRTKDEVLKELPERLEKTFFVPMTDEQWRHHEENRELVGRIVSKWRRFGFLTEKDRERLMIALQNMRMSCNSTYLLDQETDHGFKADELTVLLGEMLEDRATKAVVFSQWVRTHELLLRRFEGNGWGHVFFHGGVPSWKRGDLVRRFREEDRCRVFLSTDAGGVGLNLQNASAVVNMDQPWNPAVLEQRVGRVHRLGQHRPVRVVNFVAEGTIEHGMLDLLRFKRSMFAGVLDGGEDEVFLGGTRLKRFMESVEKVSGSIPEAPSREAAPRAEERAAPAAEELPSGNEAPSKKKRTKRRAVLEKARPARARASAGGRSDAEALGEVVSAGLDFLQKLGDALAAGGPDGAGTAPRAPSGAGLRTDEETGERYLRLPAPEPETIRKIADLFARLAGKQ
jgi:superfamily II DNA or RNA helicase